MSWRFIDHWTPWVTLTNPFPGDSPNLAFTTWDTMKAFCKKWGDSLYQPGVSKKTILTCISFFCFFQLKIGKVQQFKSKNDPFSVLKRFFFLIRKRASCKLEHVFSSSTGRTPPDRIGILWNGLPVFAFFFKWRLRTKHVDVLNLT